MNDLKDLRKKVADIITESENTPIRAENVMGLGSPKEVLEKKIDDCDAYLGIFDTRWGYIPRDNNPEKLSVTAIEYQRSRKNRIPRLILIFRKEKEKELQEFIDRISDYENGDWRSDYEDETELLRLVTRGIPKLVSKIEDQYSDSQIEDEYMHLTLLPPSVSPSIATYYDAIEDISDNEMDFITQKILHSTNSNALLSAWSDLEIFTRSKRVWRHESVWEALSKEISAFDKSDFINDAIFILKGICFTSKRDNTNEAIPRVRRFYGQKLEDVLSSKEEKLLKSKPDVKQIFEFTFTEEERFYIFWRAWKLCAKIKDDHQYSRSITAFITDLERADSKYKYPIRRELYDLIENSPDPIIRKRAKEMRSLLFS
jgi:curved DNA-binding protein CbpA